MLKGHVFKKQRFGNEIFALFIDTFLNGACGIAGNYKNKMEVTVNGNTLTVANGCVCIKGRFVEEDTSTPIVAGTDNAYCRLVIEIDLSKENTESELLQVEYKIVKSSNGYPSLTQTDIISNNSGIYQFELCQFRTSTNGITDFVDKRKYINFNSIYSSITSEYRAILEELQRELEDVEDGSAYVLSTVFNTVIETMQNTINTEMATKQKVISSGTSAPSGGSNGDIYIQYFN